MCVSKTWEPPVDQNTGNMSLDRIFLTFSFPLLLLTNAGTGQGNKFHLSAKVIYAEPLLGPELQDRILVKVITFHFFGLLTSFEMWCFSHKLDLLTQLRHL